MYDFTAFHSFSNPLSVAEKVYFKFVKIRYYRRMVSSGLLRRVALVRTVRRLLVAACVVPSSPIFVTLMKEAPGSSETSVLTRATRHNNPEDTILHSHRRENLKSYATTEFKYFNAIILKEDCCLLGRYAVWLFKNRV
jgi:hypothetical protein